MRTETITKTFFKFDELTDAAKERAREWWRNCEVQDPAWSSENRESLDAFCEIFPVKWTEYDYSYRNNIDYKITCDDEIKELSGQRLATYIYNNYFEEITARKWFNSFSRPISEPRIYHPCLAYSVIRKGTEHEAHYYQYRSRITRERFNCALTGYCMDDSLLGPIYEFLQKPDERDFEDLLSDCLNNWLKDCAADYEAMFEDDHVDETIRANRYEFTEDGDIA